jgi:repressor of nif and glnA expression
MKDARLGLSNAALLAKTVEMLDKIPMEDRDTKGALSAAEIAEHIRATGRDISNRTVSFSLQSLKKRGLAKSADGKWTLRKARSRRARS